MPSVKPCGETPGHKEHGGKIAPSCTSQQPIFASGNHLKTIATGPQWSWPTHSVFFGQFSLIKRHEKRNAGYIRNNLQSDVELGKSAFKVPERGIY